MASDKDKPKPADRGAAGGRKRPVEPRPLELTATEIRDETPAEEAQSDAGRGETDVEASTAGGESGPSGSEETTAAETAAADNAASAAATPSQAADAPETTNPQEAADAPEAAAPPRPQAGRAGAGGLIAAGVAGGIVAVAAVAALALTGLWPRGEDPALRDALAAAESRIAALEAADAEAPPPADANALTALAERVAALEARPDAPPPADLGAIESRLDALEAAAPPDLSDIEARLAALEAAPPAAALPEDAGEQLAALEDRLDRLDRLAAELAGLSERPDPTPRLDALEAALAGEQGQREALAARVNRLQDAIGEADAAALAADRDIARAAAGAVTLAALSRAVEAGRPYEDELAAIRPLVAHEGEIAALAAHAGSGLATQRGLAEAFARRAAAILAAGEDVAEPRGVTDRLAEALGGLVTVRPVGPMEGDSRVAIVSRIEAALAAGDLAAAEAEWQALDPAAQAAAADWGAALVARRAAEAELAALTAAMNAALAAHLDQPEQN